MAFCQCAYHCTKCLNTYVCTHIPAYTCSYVSDYGCEAFKPLCQHNLLRAPHTKPSRSCPPAAVEWQATKEQKGISLSVKYPDGEPLGWTCIQPKVPWPWHLCDLTCGDPTVCVSLSLCLCVHLRAHVSVSVCVCVCVCACVCTCTCSRRVIVCSSRSVDLSR